MSLCSSAAVLALPCVKFWAMNDTEQLIPTPTSEPDFPRVVTVGGISVSLPSITAPLNFSAYQYISNGTVSVNLTSHSPACLRCWFTFIAYIDSRSNLLVVQVRGAGVNTSLLSLSTYTESGFPTRSGCTDTKGSQGDCNSQSAVTGNYITRASFMNVTTNVYPIEVALITHVMGTYKHVNATQTATSVTSLLSFSPSSDTPLIITAIARTNLDVAGVDFSSPLKPKPVLNVDPLPSAQALSLQVNLTGIILSGLQSRLDWLLYWQSACVVYLPDHDDLQRFYYGAQYILGASSRLGKVAPGLWGVWVLTDGMNWHGDYTLNYNQESPVYGTYSSNRLDIALASYAPILQYIPQAKVNAKYWNCTSENCIHFPVHITAYGHSGSLGPQGLLRQHFTATFALLNLITHCEYTADDSWCSMAYEQMKGITEWWQFWLVKEKTPEGYRYVDPSESASARILSPPSRPLRLAPVLMVALCVFACVCYRCAVMFSCTNEGCGGERPFNGIVPLSLIQRVVQWMIDTSTALHIDEDVRAVWLDLLTHLSVLPVVTPHDFPYPIFAYAESNTSDSTPSPNDNPLAVYAIWPSGLISIHSDANVTSIALNTIRYYTGGWTQGNALPVFMPAAVRVGYPVSLVMQGWKDRLTACMEPNLYCYQGGGGVETAGATMAINEMLMQSNEWAINLFPVWPANSSAAFIGMRAEGGLFISANYSSAEGRVTGVEVWTDRDAAVVRLMHPWQWTQEEKERRSWQRMEGEALLRSSASITDIVVQRSGGQVDAVPVKVKGFNRPPTAQGRPGSGFDSAEPVTWYEWTAIAGERYRVLPGQCQLSCATDVERVDVALSAR